MEGTNDFLGNHGVPFETVEFNLRSMVAMALAHGKKVIIATPPPVWNDSNEFDRTNQAERIEAFRDWIYRIHQDFQIPWVDVWTYFTSHPNWETDYMANENHPNAAGYTLIAQAFFNEISKYLTSSGCYRTPH